MEFGIFDHVDRSGLTLADFYEERLKVVEAYDRSGFYAYHVAEHHATPLGIAASPSVYLAAVAQRTTQLRFGPLVCTLPLYHPLRLVEEICMLDQMSGGRFQLGIGKGISPLETKCFGIDPAERQARYEEIFAILMQGFTQKAIDHDGRFYKFRDVPMELAPLQTPHPPLWIGLASPDSAVRAGRNATNIVSLSTATETRELTDAYRKGFAEANGAEPQPKLGLGRFIIVADTDEAALAIARRAYVKWHASFHHLWHVHGIQPTRGERAPNFDEIRHGDRGIAGSPDTVIRELSSQLTEAGVNYCVGQFMFGDMTPAEAHKSIDLFVRYVMPAVRQSCP
jgi:alkanesulfonate monooxygenase SsuD/methylene tetrahydromethanopterin reductase-like flavin-dependent oxidoreductase (luciferase family)